MPRSSMEVPAEYVDQIARDALRCGVETVAKEHYDQRRGMYVLSIQGPNVPEAKLVKPCFMRLSATKLALEFEILEP